MVETPAERAKRELFEKLRQQSLPEDFDDPLAPFRQIDIQRRGGGRAGRGGRGRDGDRSKAAAAAEAARIEELRKAEEQKRIREAEAARKRAEEQRRIRELELARRRAAERGRIKMAEQTRRNILIRKALEESKERQRKLIEKRKVGRISRKDFKDEIIKLNKELGEQKRGFISSVGALTSKETREKFRTDIKKFEQAQGSKVTDTQLTKLLGGKTISLKGQKKAKIAGFRIPPKVISEFIRPTFIKRQKIRISDLASKVVKKGIRLGKNAPEIKRDVDSVINKNLKKIGVTDKNIEKFSRTVTAADIIKFQNPKIFTRQLEKAGILRTIRKVEVELETGAIIEAREKPTTAVLSFGVGRALPTVTRFVGGTKIIKKVGKITPASVRKIASKTIPLGLLGAYIAGSGLEVKRTPPGKRIRKIGGKLTTEVIPFIVGTNRGVRGELRRELKIEIDKQISKLPKRKQQAFKDLTKKSNVLGKTKTVVRDVDLKRLKRIPDAAKPTIIKFLKDQDIIVGGSLGQQTAVKVRRPLAQSDLDLYTEKDPIKAARDLVRVLEGKGFKRVNRVKGKVTIAGKKAAEFHNIDRLLANIESVTPSWKNPKSFITRTKGGIRVPKITVQLKRKLVGGFTDPKRAKDLKDARDILNQLFKRAELRARGKFFFREKNIKALEKSFGVKISRKLPPAPKLKKPPVRKPIVKRPKLPTKKFKKPVIIRKAPSVRKVGVGKGIKISKKPTIKKPKIKPSQRIVKRKPSQLAVRKPTKIKPSQRPRKKKGRPSQISLRRPKKQILLGGPSQPPARKRPTGPPLRITRRDRPSQPPVKPSKRPPPPPPAIRRIVKRPRKKKTLVPLLPKLKLRKPRKKVGAGFFIEEKRAGKFVRLKGKLLSKKNALDRLAFRLNNKISRTARIRKVEGVRRLGNLRRKEVGAFTRTRKNLRRFKVRKGKKIGLKNTFIERTRAAINTPGEKRQLRLNRLAKTRRPLTRTQVGVKRIVRTPSKSMRKTVSVKRIVKAQKITGVRREAMLKNLAKARAVKARKKR